MEEEIKIKKARKCCIGKIKFSGGFFKIFFKTFFKTPI